jgi:hypothetical protein
MTYDLTYADSNAFSINLIDSADGYTGQSLSGYTGTYDSVAVLDYVPSTWYDATYVLDQIISIEYDSADLDPTSVWYVDTNGYWHPVAIDANDFAIVGTVGTVTLNLGANSPTIATGQIVLMGGVLGQAEPPTAHPMGFIMVATMGGNIGMAWSYQGSYVAGVDWVEIILCEDATGCADPEVIKPGITVTAHTLSGQGSTTHGTTYYAIIRVCNDAGCNTVEGNDSAEADSEVDGHPTATAITVANGDGVWTVSWTATGVTDDVKNWKVCYDDSPWTVAGDMPGNCVNAADGATSADVTMSTAPGTKKYYFTAVPVDPMGNYDTAVSSADIDYVGADDTSSNPMDSDGDGIIDQLDDCPNTQINAQVDTNGCMKSPTLLLHSPLNGTGFSSDYIYLIGVILSGGSDDNGNVEIAFSQETFARSQSERNNLQGQGLWNQSDGLSNDEVFTLGLNVKQLYSSVDQQIKIYILVSNSSNPTTTYSEVIEIILFACQSILPPTEAVAEGGYFSDDPNGGCKWNGGWQFDTENEQWTNPDKVSSDEEVSSNSLVPSSETLILIIGVLVLAIMSLLFIRRGGSEDDIDWKYEDEEMLFESQASSMMYDSPAPVDSIVSAPVQGGPPRTPPPGHQGHMNDGYEITEYPDGSGSWWWKDPATGNWNEWTST